jgi:2-oxoglutarate ferredoxin oxidoreductase subunit beta
MSSKYIIQDFKSDQEVRWCPGCGDYSILAAVQRALPEVAAELEYEKERYVFVSGIGCSSRFPYYVNTFGFHGIHGRAPAIATGIKVANPKLSVWQITGDGDALAIGGNHFIHAIRRNIDINIILFDNQIYGLTKGQYSPTSRLGAVTKTSPFGTVEHPFVPGEIVLGARGTFFARTIDNDVNLTKECLDAAARHDGTSVTVVLQNCVIFNDGIHREYAHKDLRDEHTIVLRHGEPMLYGKNRDKGLVIDYENLTLKSVTLGENGITEKDILVHNMETPNPGVHMMLVNMKFPELPVALGVIRSVKDSTYEHNVCDQIERSKEHPSCRNMDELLHSGATWTIE